MMTVTIVPSLTATTTQCCMCDKSTDPEKSLVPLQCLKTNGENAHKICANCWWDTDHGFAKEGGSHKCPGCLKKMILSKS